MKTQIYFKYREWKALNKFVGLAQRDLNTSLNFQAYLCSPISRTRLRINHPIVAEAVYSPSEKSSINTILTLKAGVAKHTDTYQEACRKSFIFHRSMHNTHKTGRTHKPTEKDINTMAYQQKGHSTHTDEHTQQHTWWNTHYFCFHISSSCLHY